MQRALAQALLPTKLTCRTWETARKHRPSLSAIIKRQDRSTKQRLVHHLPSCPRCEEGRRGERRGRAVSLSASQMHSDRSLLKDTRSLVGDVFKPPTLHYAWRKAGLDTPRHPAHNASPSFSSANLQALLTKDCGQLPGTKVIATLGSDTVRVEVLSDLLRAGLRCVRLDISCSRGAHSRYVHMSLSSIAVEPFQRQKQKPAPQFVPTNDQNRRALLLADVSWFVKAYENVQVRLVPHSVIMIHCDGPVADHRLLPQMASSCAE